MPYEYAMLGDGLVPTELAATVPVATMILAAAEMAHTAQALAGALPNAQVQAMEAAAHEVPPEAIAHELRRFFRA